MEILKKTAVTILEIILVLAFCFGVLYFLFPNFFGKKKETEVAELQTEMTTHFTTEAVTEKITEEETEVTEEITEAETEEVTEALAEATTEKKSEDSSENKAGKSNEKAEKASGKAADSAAGSDDEPPFFLIFYSSPSVAAGDIFDIHKYVGYVDNIDRDVDIEVKGNVDTLSTGTYPIEVVLTDDAGNKTSRDMQVKVVDSIPSEGSRDTESFSDFISRYKSPLTEVGIDISRWQETVDFEQVKAAGCEFVYIRIGGFDTGTYYMDKYYKANIAGAKAAGLKVGVYWHAEDSSVEDVKNSVKYLMEILEDETLDLPIAYDWEDFENFENYGMNVSDFNTCFEAFANEVEARGYSVCLYSSLNFLENLWINEDNHPVWLAHYTSQTTYSGEYFMWQHSNTGRIDGVNGDVDLDVLYK